MKKLIISISIILTMNSEVLAQNWHTNLDDAKRVASINNKCILLVFQGSDWCIPCMKLDKEIWRSETFVRLANNYYVMLLADFPRKNRNQLSTEQQAQNNKLAERYNTNGYFPLVVILNNNGKVLGNIGYEKLSPIEYYNKLRSFEK